MEDQYASLKEKLEQHNYPLKYMFKFITEHDHNIALLKPHFEVAEIIIKKSKTGKYTSFSAVVMAVSADEIIEKYKSLSHIKGLMSL